MIVGFSGFCGWLWSPDWLKLWRTTQDLRPKQQSLVPAGEAGVRGVGPARVLTFDTLFHFERLDHHELAHGAFVCELDASRDLGKESVIFAPADVQAGFHTGAALADDDASTGYDLPAKCLKAKPLRV